MAGKPVEFDSGIKVDGVANLNGDVQIVGNLNVTGQLVYVGTASGDFNPNSNNSYFLGNSSLVWSGAVFNNFVSNGTSTLFRNIAVTLPAATTSIASLNMPHGVAPTTPVNGDIWTTTAGIFARISSATKNVATIDSTVNAATQLSTTRYIKIDGDATGQATFNGTANADITITLSSSYYTQSQADARFANLSAPIITTSLNPTANDTPAGNTTKRWLLYATNVNASGALAVSGNAAITGNTTITGTLTVGSSPIDTTAGHISTTANGISFTGGGTTNSNIIVTRGLSANSGFQWDETADFWKVNNGNGSFFKIVYEENVSAYAISISGNAANATYATTAANAVALNGQDASYYTDIVSRLGYTPANKAGDTISGVTTYQANLVPSSNTINLGTATARWIILANTIGATGTLTAAGNASLTANLAVGNRLDVTGVGVFANTLAVTGAVTFSNTLTVTGAISGTLSGTANDASNFNGQPASYYANADNLTSGTVSTLRLPAANATVNGAMRVIDSVTNTSITIAASANSVKRAYDAAITANTNAATADTNASNASYLSTGAVGITLLPTANSTHVRNNTANKVLTTDDTWSALGSVALTDAATIAVDMDTGLNFTVTLGGNRTLGNPTNEKVGQCGFVKITQDVTGSRTLAYANQWYFAGGTAPTLSTAASAVDVLFYQVLAAGQIYATLVKAIA